MASSSPDTYRSIGTDVRHSKEDALDDREYQLLLEGAGRMREYYGFQARFVILAAGRLGMRRSEIAHLREEWVDWRRNMIVIPRHERCTKGRDGDPCGTCRTQAKQIAEHNDISMERALDTRWAAKTDAAAREIPFDHDPRAHLVVERFFDEYDEYPVSCQSINRRINKAAELADGLDAEDIYPHALRATCASRLASQGLGIIPMQSFLGWAQASTAECYIQQSGENTARALKTMHSN